MGKPRNRIIFVSFYTPNYEPAAKALRASLREYNVEYDVRAIDHREPDAEAHDKFLANVRYKPTFIQEMAEKHKGKYDAVVWVDSDAVIQERPRLLEKIKQDLAVHYRDGTELLSGTMFWRTNFRTRKALGLWVEAVEAAREQMKWLMCPEQEVLQTLIAQSALPISVYYLPTEYCKIFDLVEDNDRAREVVPVIEHFQASRQTRVGEELI